MKKIIYRKLAKDCLNFFLYGIDTDSLNPNLALYSIITIAGLQLGSIVAFAIITESVFQWPGVGLLFINAVYFVDIPVMSAYLLLVGVLFVFINLLVDLLYLAIDPRLRDSQLNGEG